MPIVRRRVRKSGSRKQKAVVIVTILVVSLTCLVTGYGYYRVRQSQRATVAKLILESGGKLGPVLDSEVISKLPEAQQKRVYSIAMIKVENSISLDRFEIDDKEAQEMNEKAIRDEITNAIHIVAVGNKISDQEVKRIVQRGWARNW